MIKSGSVQSIKDNFGSWIYIDIGFSRKPTCGLLINDGNPEELSFADMVSKVITIIKSTKNYRYNLVVEAPLSISFDKLGNPTGRAVERYRGQTRYWYVGAGAVVTLAAQRLVYQLAKEKLNSDVLLYEGFVSFKSSATSHSRDVEVLREKVQNSENNKDCIVQKENLKIRDSDLLVSPFENMDIGIPPVIKVFG